MHASKFSLIVVLGCIAMIGAIPVGNRVAVEAVVRREDGSPAPGLDESVDVLVDGFGKPAKNLNALSGAPAARRETDSAVGKALGYLNNIGITNDLNAANGIASKHS